MKVTCRHNLVIFHQLQDWHNLSGQLQAEYGPSILLSRDRCRRELGFTVRHHQVWIESNQEYYTKSQIHLDFYDTALQTFFMLKYLKNSVV